MLVVNLYADHFLAPDPNRRIRPAEEVWYETKRRAALYERAAKAVGLTPAEYHEFRLALLDGRSVRVNLPRRLDAMSGDRHGHVYAVHNAIIRPSADGWPTGLRVTLADGTLVYVPDLCGNLSVNHAPRVAYVPKLAPPARQYTNALVTTPIDQPVSVQPPEIPTEPTIAEAVPKSAPVCGWWCFAVPLGGVIAGLVHGSPPKSVPPPPVPPCSEGSNAIFACSK